MTREDMEAFHRRFQGFALRHLEGLGPEDRPLIELKREHSLRVLAEAERILQAEGDKLFADEGGASGHEADLVRLAALYHDTGRFPQYASYKTFKDARSENHALLGVRTIKREGLLRELTRAERNLVLGAIAKHNTRTLPRGLEAHVLRAARIVRDADKLDIIPVLLANFSDTSGGNSVVSLGVRREPESYTPGMLREIMNRTLADYSAMAYENDFRLLQISWIYDLNHPCSARAFLDRDYLGRLASGLPKTPEIQTMLRQVENDLRHAAEGKRLAKHAANS